MPNDGDIQGITARLDALERMVTEREERTKERFDAIHLATRIATTAMEKRLDSMNEFRDALKDAQSQFVSRDEIQRITKDINNFSERFMQSNIYQVQHAQLVKQIEINTNRLFEIEKFIASQTNMKQDKQRGIASTYYSVGVAGVIFAVFTSLVTVIFNFFSFTSRQ